MAYTKQEFKSGDKLYAAQLNAMDEQIATNEEATLRLSEEIALKPENYNIPVLYLAGDISPIKENKDNEVTVNYGYGERAGTAKLKGQGSSSYAAAQALGEFGKYNFTIKFDEAFEVVEGWGAQKKYCLKANYIDNTHARNLVNAKKWGQIVKIRADVPEWLTALPNCGAVDGFPCVIVLNGEFHGLYTWNVPKDGWMFGMGGGLREAILCADEHNAATRFKTEATPEDFDLEYVTDEEDADWVFESLNTLINSVINATEFNLDSTVGQYLDWNSAIDYYIFTVLIAGADMTDKNYLLFTRDGVKWHFSAYDMDSTYGLDWDGKSFFAPGGYVTVADYANLHRVMQLIRDYKTDTLKARYRQIRKSAMSEGEMFKDFMNFTVRIPAAVVAADVKKWAKNPSTTANTIPALLEWYRQRVIAIDAEIESLSGISTNMFTLGKDGTEWCDGHGNALTTGMPNLSVVPGAAYAVGAADSTTYAYRNELYQNNGVTYTFGATFESENGETGAKKRKFIQLLDADGNVLNTGCSVGEYIDFYGGFCVDGEETKFTLSENVASFRVGFMWLSEPFVEGEGVVISNIYLYAE